MLTPTTGVVDAPRAVMWTISQIAERDAVSKQAVSRKARQLADDHGLSVDRNPQGHIIALNVVEYDHLRRRVDNPSKAQAPAREHRQERAGGGESYDEALRRKTWHDVEKRRLEIEEIKGRLINAAGVASGYDRAAEQIRSVLENLEEQADDLAAVVAREGAHGLRVALKRLSASLLSTMAAALRAEADSLRAAATPEVGAEHPV